MFGAFPSSFYVRFYDCRLRLSSHVTSRADGHTRQRAGSRFDFDPDTANQGRLLRRSEYDHQSEGKIRHLGNLQTVEQCGLLHARLVVFGNGHVLSADIDQTFDAHNA